MSNRKPFDIDAAQRRIEELERMKDHTCSDAELRSLNREIWKIQEKIYAEEDRQAQEYYNDPESVAWDEDMKQKNKEAHERWKAEHPDTPCYAEPNERD